MMRAPFLLPCLWLVLSRSTLPAADPSPTQQMQTSVEQLTSLFRQAVPKGVFRVMAGKNNSTVLHGNVPCAEDLEKIQQIAQEVRGDQKGEVVNDLVVGMPPVVQLNVVMARVAGSTVTQHDLYQRYVECCWKPRTMSKKGRQGAEALLEKLREAGYADWVLDVEYLTTVSCRPAVYCEGGNCMRPLLDYDGAEIRLLPIVTRDHRVHLEIEPDLGGLKDNPVRAAARPAEPIRCTVRWLADHLSGRSRRRQEAASAMAATKHRAVVTLKDGRTALLTLPAAVMGKDGTAADVVLLATVCINPDLCAPPR
jgi:hypothetical protein